MGNYNFKKDLKESENSVLYVMSYLTSIGCRDFHTNNDGKYDLKYYRTTDKQWFTAEVKNDLMWDKTHNVALEFCSRGKPSGVCTSQADLWIYVLGSDIYIARLPQIRMYLIQHWDRFKRVTGGDDRTSLLALLPIDEFENLFKKVT